MSQKCQYRKPSANHCPRLDLPRATVPAIRRTTLKGEQFEALRFAAQQVPPNAGRGDVGRLNGTVKQQFRGQQGMAGSAAGLLDPRRGVHGVTDEGYLSLESADLSGNKRSRVYARTKCRDVTMPVHEI